MRKIQTTWTATPTRTITCIGDSHTFNASLGLVAVDFYPYALQTSLLALGAKVRCRNFGIAGNTTGQMLARVACLTQFEVPTVTVIFGGANDLAAATTVQASPAPTTTTFTVGSGKGALYTAGTYLTVNGVSAKILSVATDAITLTASIGFTPTTGQAVTIDTQVNLQTIGATAITAGCSRVVIIGQHYLNYAASAGDTLVTPFATYVPLRGWQSAAATAIGAVFCDTYTSFRSRIVNGLDTQGSFSWHVLDANIHLNAYGEGLMGSYVLASIQAQSGWLAALS